MDRLRSLETTKVFWSGVTVSTLVDFDDSIELGEVLARQFGAGLTQRRNAIEDHRSSIRRAGYEAEAQHANGHVADYLSHLPLEDITWYRRSVHEVTAPWRKTIEQIAEPSDRSHDLAQMLPFWRRNSQ